jgi:hypothetical protein
MMEQLTKCNERKIMREYLDKNHKICHVTHVCYREKSPKQVETKKGKWTMFNSKIQNLLLNLAKL